MSRNHVNGRPIRSTFFYGTEVVPVLCKRGLSVFLLLQIIELIEKEELKITDEQVSELMAYMKRGEGIITTEQMLAKEKSNIILRFVMSPYAKRKAGKMKER